jgi:hypothetical protein
MENLEIIEGLNSAIQTLIIARNQLAGGSFTLWQIVSHAEAHLDAQIKALLAPIPETLADLLESAAALNAAAARLRIGNTPTCEDCERSLDHCQCGDAFKIRHEN